jgi:TatD DNase family protein
MIDTHAHLFLSESPLDLLVHRAKEAGLTHIINVATNINNSLMTIDSAKQYPDFIKASVGIHPCETQHPHNLDEIEQLAKEKEVVALGEMGLDYLKMYAPKDTQIRYFEAQLQLAERLKLPVIIHNREANEDMIAITKNFPTVKKVFHCFSGSPELLDALYADTHFFSFTGNITYSKKGKTIQAIKHLPLDKIMIETDTPYLTPKHFQGQRNEPAFVTCVLQKIAEIKSLTLQETQLQICQNSQQFFSITF